MAPSFLSTLSSALLLTCTVSATRSYQLVDNYDSTNFLDKFGFFVSDHTTGNYNDVDPTGGYVSYKSAEEAQALGLLKTVNSELYLGVDSTSKLDAAGTGRSSVRIESKSRYKKGLFVTDFSHFPKPTCGAWPAFWTVGNPWPAAGEIDIVETWNEDNVNKVVIHTDSNVGECRIDGAGMTGQVSKPNCANFAPGQSDNEGCAGLDSAAPFGSPEGGVYAMEWTDTAIRVWGFTHANVPADIATNPNPETWGTPSFTTSVCEADKVFGEAKMVMNIDFCGVAGNDGIWDQGGCQAKTGGATCKEWVANNPQAFADVYFQLKSVRIYQLKDGEASVSTSPTQVAPTSAAASSAVSTDVAGPSTATAPEKPVETVPVQSAETDAVEPTATASEAPIETPAEELTTRLATSTIYETNIKTITSCAPTVTNCPAKENPVIVTEVVPLTTTICPVVDVPTTMTVSKTEVRTITSCPPAVTNCPVGSKTTITTHEIVRTTAAIPVESYTPTKPAGGNKPVTTEKPVADITTAITTYKTNIVTITSCPPSVTNCPVGKVSTIVTSEVIPTTIPAVPLTTEVEKPVITEQPPAGQLTTYKTNIVTITSCPPSVTNCPVGKVSTIVTSEIVPITTEGEKPVPVATDAPEVPALQTTYKTNIVTITSCPPTVPDCPIGKETTIVTSEVITPTAGTPATPTDIAQNPPVPGAETTPEAPGGDNPTAPVTPGVEAPVTTAPATGATTSAEKPVAETPAVDTAMPTTLVVAPSVPSNGTLTTARFPAGTGVPCIGSACPATTTGPVQAGAGKVTSGVLALVAALVVFVI
ncbi:putative endo-1,3(4)-beta-glucanase [Colletotrichum orbiculare MAFF 240422]|uniref:Endo-1,3(4)-beta-glucanase n=1 Tax=Colletotrichum orbiculare (strain 104-T / ATCC 96160 / CBS 514.97 / LARS 414 / MAFF 240422) TaxID=1213857 RepID=N4UZJ3_COLOR|nr:putative endo-1,3(4)-beta-glucanase [Colletotrichum orbiculare MAFF 240422]